MKAGLIFTGSGPIVILTSCDSLDDPKLVEEMSSKGINRYIAYEVPMDLLKKRYGQHYNVTLNDRRQNDILRVVDWVGRRAFNNFPLEQLGEPIQYDGQVTARRKAA
jgi:hypothetical protein